MIQGRNLILKFYTYMTNKMCVDLVFRCVCFMELLVFSKRGFKFSEVLLFMFINLIIERYVRF